MAIRFISPLIVWVRAAVSFIPWITLGLLAFVGVPMLGRALSLESEELLLLVRLLLSWPAVTVVLALVAISRFGSSISALIVRGGWKLPWVDVQLAPEAQGSGANEGASPNLGEIVVQAQQLGEQRGVIKAQLDFETRRGILWEFSFLNLFFIAQTKFGLAQIAGAGGLAPEAIAQVILHQFPQMGRPETVLPALLAQGVASSGDDGLVRITRKGLAYLEFVQKGARLPLPYPAGDVVFWPEVEAARAEARGAASGGTTVAATDVPGIDSSKTTK